MNPQQHIIRRQVLELQFSRKENAAELRDQLSEIYRRRVVPLIDAYCSQLSDPRIRHRIERVEVDLGHLSLEALEETFVQRADTEIKKVLRASLPMITNKSVQGKEPQKATVKTDLELWIFFLKTGVLPWWVVNPGPRLLEETLENLLANSTRAWLQVLSPLLRQAMYRKRLIFHCSDEQLRELASQLFPENVPQWKPWIENDLEALLNHPELSNKKDSHIRFLFWDLVLTANITKPSSQDKRRVENTLKDKLRRVLKTGLPNPAQSESEVSRKETQSTIQKQEIQSSSEETEELLSTDTKDSPLDSQSWDMDKLDPATGLAIWVHFFYTGSLLAGHFSQLDELHSSVSPQGPADPETSIPPEFWADLFVRVWEAMSDGMMRLLELVMGKPELRSRFIATLPDHLLYQWMESWRPEETVDLHEWFREADKSLVPTGAFHQADPLRFRKVFWETLFTYLAKDNSPKNAFDQAAFLVMLKEEWTIAEAQHNLLPPPTEETIPEPEPLIPQDSVWQTLKALQPKLAALTTKAIPPAISKRIEATQETIQTLLDAQNKQKATAALLKLSAKYAALADQVKAFHALFQSSTEIRTGGDPAEKELLHLDDAANVPKAKHQLGPQEESGTSIQSSSSSEPVSLSTPEQGPPSTPVQEPPVVSDLESATPEPSPDSHFSEADAITVYNAGLILLWPYLTRFFSVVGLVNEEGFLDDESQTQAALLLQYVATGDPLTAEFSLPLNKILCGIPLREPIDITIPLPDTMQEAAEQLIKAVIQNWDALGTVSVEGFRQTFLQREGILKTQDGQWRLHIEHQTEDILVERIPWGIHMIKLPWMEALMTVEW